MITVQVSGFLTGFTGGRTSISLDGAPATVADALAQLWTVHPGLRDRVVNERGEVRPHVSIFVNSDHIRHRDALATTLSNGDDLTILPAISGGTAPGAEPGLRLHFNENTAGCSPAVLAAIRQVTAEDVSLYPDYGPITTTAERYFGVTAGWVQLTNGLDEGLHVVAQWAARHDSPAVIVPEPAFEMYELCAAGVGARIVRVPPGPDFKFPLEAILKAIDSTTRLVYLTDPNNPTGLGIPPGAVERIAGAAPDALVLVDEAYADFSGRTFIGPALDRRRNLIVGRTFAKAHGLAALRAGALVAHPDTLAPLRRMLPPYSLNICAVRALAAAIEDTAYRDWYVGQSRDSRQLLYDFSARHGLRCWPSEGNFVLVRVGDRAAEIAAALAARGVHVRDKSASPGCAGCLRITAGVVEHTQVCLDLIEAALRQPSS